MTHSLSGRRGNAGDIANHRFSHVLGDERRRFFLGRASDLPDHDDPFGFVVGLEQCQAVDETHSVDGISSDPDTSRLPQTGLSCLMYGFVGQSSGARDDPDFPGLVDSARHDAHLAFARSNHARTIWTDEIDIGLVHETCLDPQHVEYGYAFCDAGDDLHTGVGRLYDRISGERRRDEDHARRRPRFGHGCVHRIEHGQAQMRGAAASGGYAADQLRPIFNRLLGMESSLSACKSLHDDLGVFIDQYRH